ncbi:hypothetical protein EV424DRAFT_1342354 [Suillus variegatus]|nr:hypothetical protein EV424DRAFT_1342354 [Suillus variegatus]
MTFDPKVYHDTHATLNNYISSPTALSSTMWQHSSIGLELVNEISELPAKLIIVGWISPYRLKCGPAGNHIVNGMSPLEKAKYQFHITRPAHSDLAANHEAGIANLEMLQGQVATTDQRMSMIVNDVTGKMIHFVRNIFFLRENAIPDSPHGKAVEHAPQMDDETTHWPILDEFVLHFNGIKYNFQPKVLPIFYKDNLIQPMQTNTALNGSITEIEFTMRHWKI